MADYQEVEVAEEDESYTQEINLTNKRNTTAKVWKHFGLQLDKNNKTSDMSNPVCRLCYMPVSAKNGNTSNLYSHLMNQHPEQYKEVKPNTKPATAKAVSTLSSTGSNSIKAAFEQSKKLDPKSSEYKRLTKSVTYFIAKDMQPLNVVKQLGFKRMLQSF